MHNDDMDKMVEFLRNRTVMGRLNHSEIKECLLALADDYTLEKKEPVKPYVEVKPEPVLKPAFDISKPALEGDDV